jgi:hypothetical protein
MTKLRHQYPCQSCGAPLRRPGDHGTDLGGRVDADYCHFCFREGRFTHPDISLDEMIELSASNAIEEDVPRERAFASARRLVPTLKRWRDSTP